MDKLKDLLKSKKVWVALVGLIMAVVSVLSPEMRDFILSVFNELP